MNRRVMVPVLTCPVFNGTACWWAPTKCELYVRAPSILHLVLNLALRYGRPTDPNHGVSRPPWVGQPESSRRAASRV